MIDVFGSIGVDVVLGCPTLPRPGETVLTDDYRLLPGGKGANQALAAARAGGEVRFIGSVGQDDFGERALANLKAAGADLSALRRSSAPTACATVCVAANGENQIVVARGANRLTNARQFIELGDTDGVLLMQMEIDPEQNWAALANKGNRFAALNAAPYSPIPPQALSTLDLLIVNEVEGEMLSEQFGFGTVVPLEIARAAAERFDLTCVVTLGADGAVGWDDGQGWRAGALKLDAIDTVGAGDAFVGAFCAGVDADEDFPTCLRKASIAGGLICSFPGAQDGIPDALSINRFLNDLDVEPVT